jgi:hypothetical protein
VRHCVNEDGSISYIIYQTNRSMNEIPCTLKFPAAKSCPALLWTKPGRLGVLQQVKLQGLSLSRSHDRAIHRRGVTSGDSRQSITGGGLPRAPRRDREAETVLDRTTSPRPFRVADLIQPGKTRLKPVGDVCARRRPAAPRRKTAPGLLESRRIARTRLLATRRLGIVRASTVRRCGGSVIPRDRI